MNSKKIVLFGDGCTGKSTMYSKIRDYTDEDYTFDKRYKATDEFNFMRIPIKTNIGELSTDIWDTAGQENKGGKIRDAFLRGADGVILFYDVSVKKNTLSNITNWLEQIRKVAPNVPVAVVGNKCDLLESLDLCESVKLRECNLQKSIGHNNIKNFLISIKNDTHIEYNSTFWSSKITYKVERSCMIGLEYILSNLYETTVKVI
jgi:small GTP-binding protein